MARTQSPNSADSQFFICIAPAPVARRPILGWGEVVEGMGHVDKLAQGEPPAHPDKMGHGTRGRRRQAVTESGRAGLSAAGAPPGSP